MLWLDAVDPPSPSTHQAIDPAILPVHEDIDRARGVSPEGRDPQIAVDLQGRRSLVVRRQRPDLPGAEVAVHVAPIQRGARAHHVAADHAARAVPMVVLDHGPGDPVLVASRLAAAGARGGGPAEIEPARRPGRMEVDLLVVGCPDVADPEVAGLRIEAE